MALVLAVYVGRCMRSARHMVQGLCFVYRIASAHMRVVTMKNAVRNEIEKSGAKDAVIHAPAGFGTALLLMVGAIVAGGLYLVAVRGDALFLDMASLSGLLFCF